MELTIVSAIIALAVGVVFWLAGRYLKLKSPYTGKPRLITGVEFVGASAFVVGIVVLVTVVVGPHLAREGAINGFHEFYNGSVTQARISIDECERDGSCSRHYKCDKYEVRITDKAAYTDEKGVYHPEQYHYEDRYHECPYVTKELDYVLDTSIDRTHVIGNDYFEEDPEEWRPGSGIPGDVSRQPPERWLKAKANLEAGMADPVTGIFTYANFILASDNDLYKEYSGSIETYEKEGLLPKHTLHLNEDDMLFDYDTQATKVQAAGGLKTDLGEWQNRLMRFNAALGSELQGDLHIVLLPADKVSNPDDYITALKAYWQSLSKWSISKNAIILAIGVSSDGHTVEWSRAETGMPIGNEEMISALNLELEEEPFEPSVLLGDVGASVRTGEKVKYDLNSAGSIGQIVFNEFPFQRACMKCDDAGDNGQGYVSLKEYVPISGTAKFWMEFICFILACVIYGLVFWFDPLARFADRQKTHQPSW